MYYTQPVKDYNRVAQWEYHIADALLHIHSAHIIKGGRLTLPRILCASLLLWKRVINKCKYFFSSLHFFTYSADSCAECKKKKKLADPYVLEACIKDKICMNQNFPIV